MQPKKLKKKNRVRRSAPRLPVLERTVFSFLVQLTDKDIERIDSFVEKLQLQHRASPPRIKPEELEESKALLAAEGSVVANKFLEECHKRARERRGRAPSRTSFIHSMIQLGLTAYTERANRLTA
jgi:hypothetical protein